MSALSWIAKEIYYKLVAFTLKFLQCFGEFLELEVTVVQEIQGIGSHGVLNQSDQQT
jgi:hypothetical protein